ncbi:hypothetical protein CRUP_008518 [Coryphaenoides rupestris]|nr:hypothetical protein CRUP_008518 [Coryphaenoides rupestris]
MAKYLNSGLSETMSWTPEARCRRSQRPVRGDTICVLPGFSSKYVPKEEEEDFDLNKSYPCARRPLHKNVQCPGEGLDPGSSVASRDIQISVLHREPHGSQQHASLPHPSSASEVEEGLFSQLTSGMEDEVVSGAPVVLNPNKAILTVDHETREILAVNQQACRLFEGPRTELVGQKLSTVLRKTSQVLDRALSQHCLRADGSVAAVCGKVVDAVTLSGDVPVSVWAQRQLRDEQPHQHWLIVIEQVERISASVSLAQDGGIISCDTVFAHLHGYLRAEVLTGRMQRVSGRGRSGTAVPLCIRLQGEVLCGGAQQQQSSGSAPGDPTGSGEEAKPADLSANVSSSPSAAVYSGAVWALAPLSGLLLLLPDGSISAVHGHLALSLFGYTEDELLGKRVTFLMPGFYGWACGSYGEEEASPLCGPRVGDVVEPSSDPEVCCLLVAGDMVMVGQAALDRSAAGRGKIFTGNGARLEKADVAPSTLAAPTVTSTPMVTVNDTTELMEAVEAVLSAAGGGGGGLSGDPLQCADDTQVLLQTTFALVEPPGGDTLVLDLTPPPPRRPPGPQGQHGAHPHTPPRDEHSLIEVITDTVIRAAARPGVGSTGGAGRQATWRRSGGCNLQDSSFEVISMESRSSSGFCETFAGQLAVSSSSPQTGQQAEEEDSSSALVVDSASCYLDLHTNGDQVTRAMADLHLDLSVGVPSGDDTAELLRTPMPFGGVETRGDTGPHPGGQGQGQQQEEVGEPDQWTALSSIHNVQGHEAERNGMAMRADVPHHFHARKERGPTMAASRCRALRRRRSPKANVQCDVRRADLPDGTSVFTVWLSTPGQQGALMQSSLQDASCTLC